MPSSHRWCGAATERAHSPRRVFLPKRAELGVQRASMMHMPAIIHAVVRHWMEDDWVRLDPK